MYPADCMLIAYAIRHHFPQKDYYSKVEYHPMVTVDIMQAFDYSTVYPLL